MNLNQQPCFGVECKGCKTGTLVETDRAELRRRKQGCCLGRTNTACKLTVSIEHNAQDSSKASVRLAPKPCPARDIQAGGQANQGGNGAAFKLQCIAASIKTKPPCHQFLCGCGTSQSCGAWPDQTARLDLAKQQQSRTRRCTA
jgi:hypothetical protein